jgi:hypothetical protein
MERLEAKIAKRLLVHKSHRFKEKVQPRIFAEVNTLEPLRVDYTTLLRDY